MMMIFDISAVIHQGGESRGEPEQIIPHELSNKTLNSEFADNRS